MEAVRLLEIDRGLLAAVPAEERDAARRAMAVEAIVLDTGAWTPQEEPRLRSAAGALLVEGLLARDVLVAGRRARHLIWPTQPVLVAVTPSLLLRATVRWTVMQPAKVAILGSTWTAAVARWPGLAGELSRRTATSIERLAMTQAISQLSRIEDRVLALLLYVAEDHGRITGDGVVLELEATHAALGYLVGAQRPTVSVAVARLEELGVLDRDGSTWLIDRKAARREGWGDLVEERLADRDGDGDGDGG